MRSKLELHQHFRAVTKKTDSATLGANQIQTTPVKLLIAFERMTPSVKIESRTRVTKIDFQDLLLRALNAQLGGRGGLDVFAQMDVDFPLGQGF